MVGLHVTVQKCAKRNMLRPCNPTLNVYKILSKFSPKKNCHASLKTYGERSSNFMFSSGTAGLDIDVGIQKLCAIEKWRRFGFLHFLRRVSSVMADLKELYEKSQTTQTINQMEFTEGESANFKKAFDDPEFRKMFTEYMDEIQDPNNRQVLEKPTT